MVWAFKWEEGNSYEDKKNKFLIKKEMFAGYPAETMGTKGRILTNRLCRVPPCLPASSYNSSLG